MHTPTQRLPLLLRLKLSIYTYSRAFTNRYICDYFTADQAVSNSVRAATPDQAACLPLTTCACLPRLSDLRVAFGSGRHFYGQLFPQA